MQDRLARLARTARARVEENPFAQMFGFIYAPYAFVSTLHKKHGDIFPIDLPGMDRVYGLADPEAARQVLTAAYDQAEREFNILELLFGPEALILIDGEAHRVRRKLMNPPFSVDSVRRYGPTMLAITDDVLDQIPAAQPRELLPYMQDITMRVILRCVFGVDEGPRLEELKRLLVEYMTGAFKLAPQIVRGVLGSAGLRKLLLRMSVRAAQVPAAEPLTPSRLPFQRLADCIGRVHTLLEAEIDRRQAEADDTRSDALALLLRARFEDGQPMPRAELIQQLLLLLFGGYETTSISLCWAIRCLLEHPDAQTRARAEVATVMKGGPLDPARVRDLAYLGAVIGESMRLYPIAIQIIRRIKRPLRIGARELPAGTLVAPNQYLLHRHPAVWDDPDTFRPERMLDKRPPAYQLFPFGSSVWRCLGAALAEHEMRIVLAQLLTRFDLVPAGTRPVRATQLGLVIGPSDSARCVLVPRTRPAVA